MSASSWWSGLFAAAQPAIALESTSAAAQGARVELTNLCKEFQEGDVTRKVLNGINLQFEPGEFVVLLGHSGSGKSTLLNLISGIDQPSTGTIRIDGLAITDLDEKSRTLFRRDRIGFVFQFFNLIPTLTGAGKTSPCRKSWRASRRARRVSRRFSFCSRWGWAIAWRLIQISYLAGSSSEWRSPAPWPTIHRLFWQMSRRAT
ncbi:putative ABC transporter ATP-binding protein/MT1014 [Leptolyngbya sp. O-77]|nr:ATP-binding cassette domain-containing protein [Leptolyngbya sp. O-77]BAU44847.1 putative ABC transporter ATP-binding protein/MT1014 [Leptolyngbya sp. O-77]